MKASIEKALVQKAMAVLADMCIGQSVCFSIHGTDNDALLTLERGNSAQGAVCLRTGAVARGDDHLVQHYLHFAASMEDMKNWLLDTANIDEITQSLTELSERVSEGFD